jgi:hypothetical protein
MRALSTLLLLGGVARWIITMSSIGSPVSAGQEAAVRPGGFAALFDDVTKLDQLVSVQRSTGDLGNGMDLLLRGMFPLEPGTRVRAVSLGWDGIRRTARVVMGATTSVPAPTPTSRPGGSTAAVLTQQGLGEGWNVNEPGFDESDVIQCPRTSPR